MTELATADTKVWASVLVGVVPCRALTVIVLPVAAVIGTYLPPPIGSVERGYDLVTAPPPPNVQLNDIPSSAILIYSPTSIPWSAIVSTKSPVAGVYEAVVGV